MRKDREQRKKSQVTQLEIFNGSHAPVGSPISSTEQVIQPGVELSSRLEKQRTLTANLLTEILDYGNLDKAHKQVSRNRGASGVDKMEVTQFDLWLKDHLNLLRASLLEEQYQVSAVRKVEIPKPSGGMRTLGIPTVKDRYIQQAIHQKLNRYYDPHFSVHSYGFRPGRNAHQAIQQASVYIKEGREWVVDIDLEKFFDKINHDRLMQRLRKGIGDKRVLRLINSYLKAGLMDGGLMEQRTAGTPQGGPLSPLLSNIVLDELDKELERGGHKFCRYADDCNIYVKSRKAGDRVMESMIGFIEKKLKLKVNREKSGVRHCSEVKFLGYTLLSGGGIRVADKSVARLKEKVKLITGRNRGVSFAQVIGELNEVLIGWSNYFRLADKWLATMKSLDGWMRRKLRCYKLNQCGNRYTIYKLLRSLHIPESTSWNVVMYSQGWWAMTGKQAVNQAMGLTWFSRQGLESLYSRMQCKS